MGVISFMEKNGHLSDSRVLTVLRNWHRAVDGRGLSDETRLSYLQDIKNWLLDDWMPWHMTIQDYSTIDVNRLVETGLS